MKKILFLIALASLFLAACGPVPLPPEPSNVPGACKDITIIPPRKFSVISEKIVPVQIRLKSDGTEPDFAASLQQAVCGHCQSEAVTIVNGEVYDLLLNVTPRFTAVNVADTDSRRLDCSLYVALTPANGHQKYADKNFLFSSQKVCPDAKAAKEQYLKPAMQELSSWTIQQLNAMNENCINAVNIRIGLRNPLVQFDPDKQYKEAIAIGNFLKQQNGVISSKLIEFDQQYKVCTFRVLFFTNRQPERFTGLLTREFQ